MIRKLKCLFGRHLMTMVKDYKEARFLIIGCPYCKKQWIFDAVSDEQHVFDSKWINLLKDNGFKVEDPWYEGIKL